MRLLPQPGVDRARKADGPHLAITSNRSGLPTTAPDCAPKTHASTEGGQSRHRRTNDDAEAANPQPSCAEAMPSNPVPRRPARPAASLVRAGAHPDSVNANVEDAAAGGTD